MATRPSDRALQRALLQFLLPENYYTVKKALQLARREDLIGDGPECLIPARPSRLAREARTAAQARRKGAPDPLPGSDPGKPAPARTPRRGLT